MEKKSLDAFRTPYATIIRHEWVQHVDASCAELFMRNNYVVRDPDLFYPDMQEFFENIEWYAIPSTKYQIYAKLNLYFEKDEDLHLFRLLYDDNKSPDTNHYYLLKITDDMRRLLAKQQ